MSKPVFVISCPIDTYSGYGARSRDIVRAIIELEKYDVKILPQRWGNTPKGFIKDNPEWEFLTKHFLNTPQLPAQPEIWMQITVPNEFQPIGKYNIGSSKLYRNSIKIGVINLILTKPNDIRILFNTSYKPILIDGTWYSDYKSASSVERIEAFIKLGVPDPVLYADETGPVSWEVAKAHVEKILAEHSK